MDTIAQYEKDGLGKSFIIIDTNHDNSAKSSTWIKSVSFVRPWLTVTGMRKSKKYVRGFMIESI